MWSFALITVFIGYALVYYGLENIKSGGQGPMFADVIGVPRPQLTGKRAETTMTGKKAGT